MKKVGFDSDKCGEGGGGEGLEVGGLEGVFWCNIWLG